MIKRSVSLLAVLLLLVFVAGCGGRNADFGYVDMQKVMQESAKAKELQAQLENKMKEIQAALEKDQAALDAEAFTQKQQAGSAEMQAYGRNIEEQFRVSMVGAMEEIAREKNLGAVLVQDSVLQGGTDITDEVIKRMK